MTWSEVLLTVVLLGVFLWRLSRRRLAVGPVQLGEVLPVAAMLAALIQLVVVGYRWQLLPMYVVTLATFGMALEGLFWPDPEARSLPGWLVIVGMIVMALALIAGTVLATVLPVPEVPAPSGPHQVGTVTYWLTDPSRKEVYGSDDSRSRELLVQIWYPAAPGVGAVRAPWLDEPRVMAPAIARWVGLPSFSLGHLALADSHAYQNAAGALGLEGYPVVLFSHGWGGFRSQDTFLMQELASHGYVAVGLQHPYGAVATVFPDGRVVRLNPQALPIDAAPAELRMAAQKLGEQWAEDMSFVVDYMLGLNIGTPASPLQGLMNLERIGASGHSTGGGAAIEFCRRDARCDAYLGLDPYMMPVSEETFDGGLDQPGLYLFSEMWSSEENSVALDRLVAESPIWARAVVAGTDHYDLTDMPALSPLASALGLKGPLEGERVLEIVGNWSVGFFDRYLKVLPGPDLETLIPGYPEVTFHSGD